MYGENYSIPYGNENGGLEMGWIVDCIRSLVFFMFLKFFAFQD
jgi:hypothetical protein